MIGAKFVNYSGHTSVTMVFLFKTENALNEFIALNGNDFVLDDHPEEDRIGKVTLPEDATREDAERALVTDDDEGYIY